MGLFKTLRKQKDLNVYAPTDGKIGTLESLEDGVFSDHLLGEGVVIESNDGIVRAPFDGTVVMTMDSKHAIGLMSDSGIEVLIHIGIDTVTMNGEGFNQKIQKDSKVKKGDILTEFSKEKISKAGFKDSVIIIVSNSKEYESVKPTTVENVNVGDVILNVK